MTRLMALLALGLASCPAASSPQPSIPPTKAPGDDDAIAAPDSKKGGPAVLESEVFVAGDTTLRSAALALDAQGRTRWLVQDNNNRVVHLSRSADGAKFARVRESRTQAKRLPEHVIYDASRDTVWRLFVDKTSFVQPHDPKTSPSQGDPVEVPLGGTTNRGRSGVETYRVSNEMGHEGTVGACPAPARGPTPAQKRGKRQRGMSAGDRTPQTFCDHVIIAAHADSRGLFVAGSLEADRQHPRPWAGLLDADGAFVWQAPLLIEGGNVPAVIRQLVVAEDDVYAIAMLGAPFNGSGRAYLVRIDPRSGEARLQRLPGPTTPSGWAAIATEQDRVWVAMYQHGRSVALLELLRDGTLEAAHEIELQGRVGHHDVAALRVDTETLTLATARAAAAEPAVVELIRMDRNGTVLQRERGQLPQGSHPRSAQWTGGHVTISVDSSTRGPVLHRFELPR